MWTRRLRRTEAVAAFILLLGAFVLGGCATRSAFLLSPESDQANDAIKKLRAAAEEQPDYTNLQRLGWGTWFLTNDSSWAREHFQAAIAKDPAGPEARIGAGLAAFLQADIEPAIDHFLTVIAENPGSPYAELAATELNGMSDFSPNFDAAAEAIFRKVLDDTRYSYRTKILARTMLMRILRLSERLDEADALDKQQGLLTTFSIMGPFGNFGLIDFDKRYQPETSEAIPTDKYTIDEREIEVMTVVPDQPSPAFSDLGRYGGVYYAAAYIKLDNAATVVVRLDSERLTQVSIDDQPVLSQDIRTHNKEGIAESGVALAAGWHKVLVKFGNPYNSFRFDLQLLDLGGAPVVVEQRPATDADAYAAYKKQQAPTRFSLSQPMETVFAKQAETDPNFYTLFLATLAASETNSHTQFKQLIRKALAINGQFAPLYVVRGLSIDDDPAIPAGVANETTRQDLSLALELDGRMAFARAILIGQKLKRDKLGAALEELDTLIAQSPDFYLWYYYKFTIYDARGWTVEADAAAERVLELAPHSQDMLRAMLQYALDQDRFELAEKITLKLDKLAPEAGYFADWEMETGQVDKAIAFYEKVAERNPDDVGTQMLLARLYKRVGQLDKTIAIIEALRKHPSYEFYQTLQLAEYYVLAGKRDRAIALLEAALAEKPANFGFRRMLAFYRNAELLGDYATDGLALIKEYEASDFKPDDGTVMVLDEYIGQYFPDGSAIGRVHYIVHLQTKDALDQWGEVKRPFNAEVYQLRVIKPDGRILIPDRIKGKSSVTLPSLDIGDYVELDYLSSQKADQRLYGSRMDASKFYFRMTNNPVYRSHLTILHNGELPINFQELNYDALAAPTITQKDGYTVRTYVNTQLDAIRNEPFMPLEDDVFPLVYHTRPLKWDELRDYWRQQISGTRVISPAVEDFLAAHRGNAKGRELIEKLFYAIGHEIDGENNDFNLVTPVSYIVHNKRGNRLMLLSALLNILGVPNEFVLARSINAPSVDYTDANPSVYDEILLRVRPQDGGEALYLTGQYESSLFNTPSPMLSGAQAMVLGDGSELFVTLPDFMQSGQAKEVHLLVNLAEDGSAECEGVERSFNYYTGYLRMALRRITPEQIKQFMEMQINRDFPGASLTSHEVRNLDDFDKPLELHYTFKVPHMAKKHGPNLVLPVGAQKLNFTAAYIRTASREYPMLINGVNSGYMSTVIKLPSGFSFNNVPESLKIQSPFGQFELEVDQNRHSLALNRDYTIPIQRIPTKDYVDFYKFCATVDKLERSEIIIVPN